MEPTERRARMHRLRHTIKRHDVFWWVDAFLDAAFTPGQASVQDQLSALEADSPRLRAANDPDAPLPDTPVSDTPSVRRPRANLLN